MTDTLMPTLQLEGVRKSYGAHAVLRGFSGTFVSGRIAALVGPNGAGKTTLLRIAADLQRADAGIVRAVRVLYYGGYDLLPIRGKINGLRRALQLPPITEGDRNLAKLSRGELHRVGLDIAFELAPDILLLDEPWTALEPDARQALSERLRFFAERRVVVCSTHDLDEVARIADDVVFLTNGVGIWKRREDAGTTLDRDALIQFYRETKQS